MKQAAERGRKGFIRGIHPRGQAYRKTGTYEKKTKISAKVEGRAKRARWKEEAYQLEISGHAGYCPGNDIVCAAASALAHAFRAFLASKHMKYEDVSRCGYVKIVLKKSNLHKNRFVQGGLACILEGFSLLEKTYPGYVKTNYQREAVRDIA